MSNNKPINPKPSARSTVIQARIDHPEWTLAIIADKANITRERARTILKSRNMPTCSTGWGVPKLCTACNKKIAKTSSYNLCYKCRMRYTWVEATCDKCGNTFKLHPNDIRTRKSRSTRIFCSRECSSSSPRISTLGRINSAQDPSKLRCKRCGLLCVEGNLGAMSKYGLCDICVSEIKDNVIARHNPKIID